MAGRGCSGGPKKNQLNRLYEISEQLRAPIAKSIRKSRGRVYGRVRIFYAQACGVYVYRKSCYRPVRVWLSAFAILLRVMSSPLLFHSLSFTLLLFAHFYALDFIIRSGWILSSSTERVADRHESSVKSFPIILLYLYVCTHTYTFQPPLYEQYDQLVIQEISAK